LTKEEAIEMFKQNKYKVELISEKVADGTTCTAYRCGPLIDLCKVIITEPSCGARTSKH